MSMFWPFLHLRYVKSFNAMTMYSRRECLLARAWPSLAGGRSSRASRRCVVTKRRRCVSV